MLAGDGESAVEIVHYMSHVLNVTNLNEKILKGLTLQLVVQNYPKRNKFAAVDSGTHLLCQIQIISDKSPLGSVQNSYLDLKGYLWILSNEIACPPLYMINTEGMDHMRGHKLRSTCKITVPSSWDIVFNNACSNSSC